jgi:multicomponent K+:H+ antiporter subunit A
MSPALIAILPFAGALLPGLLARRGTGAIALACAAVTLAALVGLCLHIPAVLAGETVQTRIDWLPGLGLGANFRLDGLGLLFGILILGIGLLIIAYARSYLGARDSAAVFFGCLMLFQGAMTGIVLSENILLLLVFWELTSLSSFLLIGYWRHLPEGRQGARMALTVTGMGGLALIAGMLILGHVAGGYDFTQILMAREVIQASPLYLPALLLILLGAFAKSAQFPFQFWLPHAMAAPTPVSAYLHSATMVKAGIFLLARLWPVLSGTPEWFCFVAGTGLVTMVLGAWIALFRDDLKSLLAYSTVSHLGLITMLLGFGTRAAALAAMFHILNHASFKAALFMAAGIVDHGAGTRAISRLGGLRRLMPLTFAIMSIAALSMAGIPPLNGFLSKELMLENAGRMAWHGNPWLIGALATLGAAFSVCYSLRLVWQVFLGPGRDDYPQRPHDPGAGLWLSPALLAGLVVLIGLMPDRMAGWLVRVSASATTGAEAQAHFALWHGVTPALQMSLAALAGGVALLTQNRRLILLCDGMAHPDGKAAFDVVVGAARAAAGLITDRLTNGAMSRALAGLILTSLACGSWAFSTGGWHVASRRLLEMPAVPVAGWLALVAATCCLVIFHRQRLLALLLLGIVGLMVSGAFVYLSAPDLALTQISVEVVTVILLLLALNFLPRHTPVESRARKRGMDALVATLGGLGFGALAHAVLRSDFALPPISGYMLDSSRSLGGGDNVVNVILVDFRGYDTFGEITVLGVAALGIFALTESLMKGLEGRYPQGWHPQRSNGLRRAGDPHPLLLVVASRFILPLLLVAGLYIFLRGHNAPGGGFVAGLVVAIAMVTQYMASGRAWAQQRQRIPYHALIGAGMIAAGLTGIAALAWGLPFLTSAHGHVALPGLEPFGLASAMGFDLGVFL